jgi:anti-sigma regulatory factor (Ser/Thr protein kinase)
MHGDVRTGVLDLGGLTHEQTARLRGLACARCGCAEGLRPAGHAYTFSSRTGCLGWAVRACSECVGEGRGEQGGPGAAYDLARLARLLGAQVANRRVCELPGGALGSARLARRYVRDVLGEWAVAGEAAEALEQITGELVANAVEHTDSAQVLVYLLHGVDGVTVTVADEGRDGDPLPRVVGEGAERGRGLALVAALAEEWDHHRTPRGTAVWARVAGGPGGRR